MSDIEIGFLGLVVTCILFAGAVGWWWGWRNRGEWDEGTMLQAYRAGRKSVVKDIAKHYRIELGVVKAEKELKRELIGK